MYLKFRYFVFLTVFTICIPNKNFAQNRNPGEKVDVNIENDHALTDTTSTIDSASVAKKNDNFIDTQVKYNASDSIILSSDNKKVYLFKEAKVEYGDIVLEADYIEYDQEDNFVFARGVEDTLGVLQGKPKFKDKSDEFVAKTIKYNFKTKKGYIQEVFTEEEQGFLHSSETKKLEDNSFLLRSGKYTTCENEDHPHFYLSMSKAKVIPNDKIISGPAYLVMEDIPIKFLGIPFGFFPSQSEYSSGVMIPTYGEEKIRGFFLRDGGYYFGISDKMDLSVTGSIYSKGSWASDVKYRFKKRYKFNSDFSFSYSEFVKSEEGLPDYTKSKDMAIRWAHTQDPKANPNSTFSASVNYSTSSYDQYNSTSLAQRNTNTKSSSISYTKSWPDSPFRMTAKLNHSQNSNTNNISLTLPVMTFSMDRQYPFRRKNSTGETKWFEDIVVQYTSNLENKISTKDTLLFNSSYSDNYITGTKWSDYENGFKHSIPISTNFKILQHFNLTPKIEYTGILYPNYVEYTSTVLKDEETNQSYVDIDTTVHETFKYAQLVNPSISLSVGPNIYGMYQMKNPESKLVAVRHVITPSVGVSYRPDLGSMVDGYYEVYYSESDTLFENPREYSIFKDGVYGLPAAPGESGSISFGLNNNLEMKIRDYEDTTGTGTKKIKLLESLKLSTSYNMFADSLNWSDLSISARTSMFENKLSFQAGASVDPYALNQETGKIINEFQWEKQGGLGRLTNFNLSVDLRLNPSKDKDKDDQSDQHNHQRGDRFTKYEDGHSQMQQNLINYVDFDIPWNLSIAYKYSYNKSGLESTKNITQTATIRGDVSLTKKWKISFTANYDLVENDLSNGSINIHRDLHCWEASFSWIPVGTMQSYNFQINVKGSTLRDFLKYNKRKSWQDNL